MALNNSQLFEISTRRLSVDLPNESYNSSLANVSLDYTIGAFSLEILLRRIFSHKCFDVVSISDKEKEFKSYQRFISYNSSRYNLEDFDKVLIFLEENLGDYGVDFSHYLKFDHRNRSVSLPGEVNRVKVFLRAIDDYFVVNKVIAPLSQIDLYERLINFDQTWFFDLQNYESSDIIARFNNRTGIIFLDSKS